MVVQQLRKDQQQQQSQQQARTRAIVSSLRADQVDRDETLMRRGNARQDRFEALAQAMVVDGDRDAENEFAVGECFLIIFLCTSCNLTKSHTHLSQLSEPT